MRSLLAFCVVLVLSSCFPKESKPVTCISDDECRTKIGASQGVRCDLTQHACICDGTAYPGCEKFIDGGSSADGAIISDAFVSQREVAEQVDVAPDAPGQDGPGIGDGAMSQGEVTVQVDSAGDVVALDAPELIDTRVPDAAGTCGLNSDCTDPKKAFCVYGVCVGCQSAGASACVAPTPGCDLTTGMCVGCTTDNQCTADPAKGFCVAESCVGCNTPGATGCTARTDGKTACATTGQCVECTTDSQCTKDAAKGFCVANVCTGCNASGATGCAARTDGKTTCATTGQCVECTADSQCTKDAAKGFCVANACTGCNASGAAGCSGRTDSKTTCAVSGTFAGQCVVCASNAQCSGPTPICATATDTCRACTADSECSGIGPGVCMSHQDGRCASSAETIIVTSSSSNLPSTSVPSGIRLVVIRGSVTGTLTWTLTGAQMTIVGQSSGTLTGPASTTTETGTIKLSSGDLYIRGLSITGGSPGIWATSGILRLDHVTVSNNTAGGILLDGAGFDIKDTTVNSNGPNSFDSAFGGIRIQNAPTSTTIPKTLSLSTVNNNQQVGVSCGSGSAPTPAPTTVLVSGSSGAIDVSVGCDFSSCGTASTTCGAQP